MELSPSAVDLACVGAVLGWLPPRLLLRAGAVSRTWRSAGFCCSAWEELRLYADRPARCAPDRVGAGSVGERNIHLLGDEALFHIAARLRDVPRGWGACDLVGRGAPRSPQAPPDAESPLDVLPAHWGL